MYDGKKVQDIIPTDVLSNIDSKENDVPKVNFTKVGRSRRSLGSVLCEKPENLTVQNLRTTARSRRSIDGLLDAKRSIRVKPLDRPILEEDVLLTDTKKVFSPSGKSGEGMGLHVIESITTLEGTRGIPCECP